MRDIFRRPYRGTLFVPANRLSSPNDRAESLLLTSIGKLNLSATFYSRESLRYFVKCLQGARLEIPIVSRQSCHLVPRTHDQSLTLNDIAGPRGPGPGAHKILTAPRFPDFEKKNRLFCSLMKIESWFKLYEAAWLERVWTFLQYRWIILKLRCGFVKVTRKISFRQFSNLQNFNSYCLLESRSPQSPASNKMAAFVGAHAITCGSTFVEYCTN